MSWYALTRPIISRSRQAQPSLQVVKFKTDQVQDVKKVEKLNNLFFRLMSTKKLDGVDLDMEGEHRHSALWIAIRSGCDYAVSLDCQTNRACRSGSPLCNGEYGQKEACESPELIA